MKSASAATYDAFAEAFSQTRHKQNFWPEFGVLLPYLDRLAPVAVVDVGCGNGRLRRFLPHRMVPEGQYTGLEQSLPLLQAAESAHPTEQFMLYDMHHPLPYAEASVPVITHIASFHHLLSRAAQRSHLAECARVLQPGGLLFLTTWVLPEKYRWANYRRGRFWNWVIPFGPERHPRVYRRTAQQGLVRLLERAGLLVQQRGTTYHPSGHGRNHYVLAIKPQ
ncbi:class I SAM-dependent methyltransferase [Candidatus Peribacteria bacterium]|nr:class I SAM-dependent methyltransferase [Candidatus Peribacteria bacterium]